MEVHRILGKGLLEIIYKDAIEYEFTIKKIPYEREKKYTVEYKGIVMLQMNLDFAPPPTMELCGASQRLTYRQFHII